MVIIGVLVLSVFSYVIFGIVQYKAFNNGRHLDQLMRGSVVVIVSGIVLLGTGLVLAPFYMLAMGIACWVDYSWIRNKGAIRHVLRGVLYTALFGCPLALTRDGAIPGFLAYPLMVYGIFALETTVDFWVMVVGGTLVFALFVCVTSVVISMLTKLRKDWGKLLVDPHEY